MSVLVADISNGRTKWAMAQEGHIVSAVRLCPTADLTSERMASLCADWRFDRVVLCSVVPAATETAVAYFSPRLPLLHVSPEGRLPVDFSTYAGRATLGADRVANALAAATLSPGHALAVIDAGTATTVDVVLPALHTGEKPRFLGGAIAPGVGTMARALHGGTAQLPVVPLALPRYAVGQSTVEALQNGCVRGYRGLLRELVCAMEQECGCTLNTVLTGGDASLLAELMPELGHPEPLLTLQGIALYAKNVINC